VPSQTECEASSGLVLYVVISNCSTLRISVASYLFGRRRTLHWYERTSEEWRIHLHSALNYYLLLFANRSIHQNLKVGTRVTDVFKILHQVSSNVSVYKVDPSLDSLHLMFHLNSQLN
jgi:hypothetical protein